MEDNSLSACGARSAAAEPAHYKCPPARLSPKVQLERAAPPPSSPFAVALTRLPRYLPSCSSRPSPSSRALPPQRSLLYVCALSSLTNLLSSRLAGGRRRCGCTLQPQDVVLKRDDDVSAENVTLSTFFTTETFTASQKFQSMMKGAQLTSDFFLRAAPDPVFTFLVAPWVTTITTETVWTVAHTVTRPVPTAEPTSSA